MTEKSYLAAEAFNWQYEAEKRIGCQSISLHQLQPSFIRSIQEKVLDKIGYPEGIDGYLLQLQIEEGDLPEARKKASQNPSPYVLVQLISREGEEYWGLDGEVPSISNPGDYLAEKNIYFNRLANGLLNRAHHPRDPSLKEAISSLIDPQHHGSSEYLERALGEFYHGGEVDLESMLVFYPALSWMIKRIKDQRDGLDLLPFIQSFLRIPYGLPIQTVYLFFALSIHHFQETIWCKVDPQALGEAPLSQMDFFYSLLTGDSPRARIYLRPLSPEEKENSAIISQIFSPGEGSHLISSYRALTGWYRSLPPISRRARIHVGEMASFIQRMEYLPWLGYSLFLRRELPGIFSQVQRGLMQAKGELEKAPERIFQELLTGVKESFPRGIQAWTQQLNDYQLDLQAPWQDVTTCSLLEALLHGGGQERVFLNLLLKALDFGLVEEWERDHRQRFFSRVLQAVEKINQYQTPIPRPLFHTSGEMQEENTYYFDASFLLTIEPPQLDTLVMLTDNGEDPRRDTPSRTVISRKYQYHSQKEGTIRLVSCRSGYYGEPLALTFVDRLKDYRIVLEENLFTGAGVMEPKASFVLPQNQKGIQCTLFSLFTTLQQRGLSIAHLENLVLEVLDSLTEDGSFFPEKKQGHGEHHDRFK